jgi:hypothetical protein
MDMLDQRDMEATLRALLMQFQANTDLDPERIIRFAQTGAEALLMQTRLDTWLDSEVSAELLHMTVDELHEQIRSGVLPAARSSGDEPRFHRRDVCLYWLSQQLGSAAPLVPLGAWRDETDVLGFDPWGEATPG